MGGVVGRFRIEEALGEDVFGELHRAAAIDGGGDAIVRIVRTQGGTARRERLIREANRAARLKHDGLAAVLEVGETESGDMFVAVERIEGERLSDRLRVGPVTSPREAAAIATQIAHALAVAHDAGVVHRNLRPSLIALSGEGEATRVKVEGLATPRSSSASSADDDPELAFAAPEQLRGELAGRRADVYSIGALLQVMLTGRPPELGASGTSRAPAIEGALGDVVRCCLAEDPRERFLDTVALAEALRAAMDVPAPRVSSRPPPSKQASPPLASTPPVSPPSSSSSRPPASAPARGPASAPAPARGPASAPARGPARPPSAPPARPLGRPLTARPRWKEALVDLSGGSLPRVAMTALAAFAVASILTSGVVPFVVALAAGVAAYATKYGRGPRRER